MTAPTPGLPLHQALQREKWRRTVEAAGPGDLDTLKRLARVMIDGYYGNLLHLNLLHRQQLSAPCAAGPQLPRLPKQPH